MKIHVVIPARLGSTRLPEKPLAVIAGMPMIVRVARQAARSNADDVVVAVDDQRVRQIVENAGYQAMLTAKEHRSGSDRVMEVASRLGWSDRDIVINVQGDEPLLPPALIDQLSSSLCALPDVGMATLSELLQSSADFLDPNVVKVVCDKDGRALYFSRAPVPFPREIPVDELTQNWFEQHRVARHVGIYAFRVSALSQFIGLPPSLLENIECLEQLRWLESGQTIQVLPAAQRVPAGVDTPEDLLRVENFLATSSS